MSVYDLLKLNVGDQVRRVGGTAVWDVVDIGAANARVKTAFAGGVEMDIGARDCGLWSVYVRSPRKVRSRV